MGLAITNLVVIAFAAKVARMLIVIQEITKVNNYKSGLDGLVEMCQSWFHGLCQNLQNTEVNSIGKLNEKGVQWFCDSCIGEVRNATKGGSKTSLSYLSAISQYSTLNQRMQNIEELISAISTTLTANETTVEKRFEQLEKSYADAVQENTVNVKKSLEVNEHASKMLAKQVEISQSELRRKNAI